LTPKPFAWCQPFIASRYLLMMPLGRDLQLITSS